MFERSGDLFVGVVGDVFGVCYGLVVQYEEFLLCIVLMLGEGFFEFQYVGVYFVYFVFCVCMQLCCFVGYERMQSGGVFFGFGLDCCGFLCGLVYFFGGVCGFLFDVGFVCGVFGVYFQVYLIGVMFGLGCDLFGVGLSFGMLGCDFFVGGGYQLVSLYSGVLDEDVCLFFCDVQDCFELLM